MLILSLFHPLGGADKNVVVFDRREEQIVATLKGHTKKVTSVIYHPSQVAPSSSSNLITRACKSRVILFI